MSITTIDEARIKELFKQAMIELFQEEKGLFSGLFADAVEEIGLVNAIKEGEDSESVSRETVFQILEGANCSE